MTDDTLARIFERQLELQKKSYGIDPSTLGIDAKLEYIRMMTLALTSEAHEALDEVSWKAWQTSAHINREAFVGELVDALHFLVNLFLAAGCGPDEVATRYFDKANKNAKRQEDGYDGVSTKCPKCRRDYNDIAVLCVPLDTIVSRGVELSWCAVDEVYFHREGV